MKKILLFASTGIVLVLCCRWLVLALASDETKIRRLVGQMEAGYDEGQPSECVGPLAQGWHHEGYEFDRELLRGALLQTALQDRDKATKELLTRVDVLPDSIAITVDGETAKLACEVVFSRLRKGTWEETWRMAAEADLVDGEDGWEIVKSRHVDLRGTQLGR